jgi:SecD/SecF fusion protein
MEVDQNFIAAVLTIIGFSINDTVVVFDRIREYLGTHHHDNNKEGIINSRAIPTCLMSSLKF